MPDPLYSLLQFSDGLYPSGGFAHSFGLEAYAQAGLMKSREDALALISSHLEGAAGPCDAVVVHLALAATRHADLPALLRLDATLDAMKVVREFREASSQMGRQTVRAAVACSDDPVASSYRKAIEDGKAQGHQAVVFGLIGGVLGWNEESAVTAFLYSTSSLLCHAAVRLIPLGQRDGQWVLSALAPLVRRLAKESIERQEEDLSSFEPALEIRGMRHEWVDGRMFRS